MAYKEITVENEGAGGTAFFKFDAVGKSVVGRFLSVEQRTNQFGKIENQYTLRTKAGDLTFSAPTNLDQKLKKAELKRGYGLQIIYTSDLPPTQEGYSPMKLFKVLVDDASAAPAKAAPSPVAPAPAKAAPVPVAPDDLEDIPL